MSKEGKEKEVTFFSTHPSSETRIKDLEKVLFKSTQIGNRN